MGTQEEKDWVEVANDLLSKCHINLRLKKLTGCDASVFVSLYEAILGEKVPDYIAVPSSQEDDIHNVQSVIDSLALDYLQISLSHITGENIVRGDKESIRNLLEIFDGLLEYLTEQISDDESQNGEWPGHMSGEAPRPPEGAAREQTGVRDEGTLAEDRSLSSRGSTVRSSPYSAASWDAEGSESTAELIRLGDSARTFAAKNEAGRSGGRQSDRTAGPELAGEIRVAGSSGAKSAALAPSSGEPGEQLPFKQQRPVLDMTGSKDVAVDTTALPVRPVSSGLRNGSGTQLREPIRAAVPLRPPCQPAQTDEPPCGGGGGQAPAGAPARRQEGEEAVAMPTISDSSRPLSDTLAPNGHHFSQPSPGDSERSVSSGSRCASQKKASLAVERDQTEALSVGPKKVAFRTQPDIRLLTLQSSLGETQRWGEEEEEGSEEDSQLQGRGGQRDSESSVLDGEPSGGVGEEPLSWRRRKNRQAEMELQEMSEKLSRRLEELDLMLKQALGETTEAGETKEEDKLSHHSDSVMECRRTKKQTDEPQLKKSSRTRSLSPSPPPARRPLQAQFEDALHREAQHHLARARRHAHAELETHRQSGLIVGKAYEDELRRYEERERIQITQERGKAKEALREYEQILQKEAPRTPKPARVYSSRTTPRAAKPTAPRGSVPPRKAPPMKVKENDLLPLLLEEFPHLQLSPHTLKRMWNQQLRQVGRLGSASSGDRSRAKLTSQVEDAQRKHDLLVEIIRKEQEHNQRLRDFKDRIRQQKSAQNQMKEQRQQIARARKYYDDYHVQLKARMMRARTREEKMFRQLFEEGLGIQKERLQELRSYAKAQRQEHQRRHRDELDSMENYYRDQFSLLAETLAQERQEIQVRKKAQEKALQKMKKELRSKMEREIRELQQLIIHNDDDDSFRNLEIERLRRRVQMASFQYSTSHLL
nr:PREDICTED: centrosomal protein of 95 kDa isoform X1 [Lepisosteus oculatus]